jgi:hypothetical protein
MNILLNFVSNKRRSFLRKKCAFLEVESRWSLPKKNCIYLIFSELSI